MAIAREIQHLVHSLPHATTDGSRSKTLDSSLLSNASFMNGSSQKRKPSVWDILENLHCTSPNSNPNPPCSSTTSSPTYIGSEAQRSSPEKGDEPTTASSSNIYPNPTIGRLITWCGILRYIQYYGLFSSIAYSIRSGRISRTCTM